MPLNYDKSVFEMVGFEIGLLPHPAHANSHSDTFSACPYVKFECAADT